MDYELHALLFPFGIAAVTPSFKYEYPKPRCSRRNSLSLLRTKPAHRAIAAKVDRGQLIDGQALRAGRPSMKASAGPCGNGVTDGASEADAGKEKGAVAYIRKHRLSTVTMLKRGL
jgi:hypothetical protein